MALMEASAEGPVSRIDRAAGPRVPLLGGVVGRGHGGRALGLVPLRLMARGALLALCFLLGLLGELPLPFRERVVRFRHSTVPFVGRHVAGSSHLARTRSFALVFGATQSRAISRC